MAYIEAHQALGDHYKTKRAARFLNVPTPVIIGHLMYLWWWALDNAPDGDLYGLEPWEIAEAAQFEGDGEVFVAALLSCGRGDGEGFLERGVDGRLIIHDWGQYGGKLVEKRETDAYRLWLKRNRMEDSEEARSLYDERRRTSPERRTDVAGRKEKTSQEKRSVEKTSQPGGGGGAGNAPASSAPDAASVPGPTPKVQQAGGGATAAVAGSVAGDGDMPNGKYPEGWHDAETVSPEVLLARFKAAFPDCESRLAQVIAASPNPVTYQAKYLRPYLLRCLRGEEPDPITTVPASASSKLPAAVPSDHRRFGRGTLSATPDEIERAQRRYLDLVPPGEWERLEGLARRRVKLRSFSAETICEIMRRIWREETQPASPTNSNGTVAREEGATYVAGN